MNAPHKLPTSATVVCPECRGSGMRAGCDGREFECFDCGGAGEWEEEAIVEVQRDFAPDNHNPHVSA